MNNDKLKHLKLNVLLSRQYIVQENLEGVVDKFDFIAHLAEILFKRDLQMRVSELARILNELEYKTDYDEEFKGGRGTYRLVSAAYARMKDKYGQYFAEELAKRFITEDGGYAYS